MNSTIEIKCQCGKRLRAKADHVGKRVRCPACGAVATVSAPGPPTADEPGISVTCQCGRRFTAKPGLAGRQVRCPECKHPIQVPDHSTASSPSKSAPSAPEAAYDDLWDDLPEPASTDPGVPTDSAMAAVRKTASDELMANARAEQVERKKDLDSWATKQVISGIGMMLGAVVWFGLGLFAGRIFFYPPVLFVFGAIALYNGLGQKLHRDN